MGYMNSKYTRGYFLKEDKDGNGINIGVEGAELFKENKGKIRQIDQTILSRLNFEGKNVLEFGYGRGEVMVWIKENGASNVVGVDFSEDAYYIAKEYSVNRNVDIGLFCLDALEFIAQMDKYIENGILFDVVVMFDFVEHVPRVELTRIFELLKAKLSNEAVIVINTPIFPDDNDLIQEGLKLSAVDSSDYHESTAGMHCNRYTLDSLIEYMGRSGFSEVSGHYFTHVGRDKIVEKHPELRVINTENDVYERTVLGESNGKYKPSWHTIKGGILKGKLFFVDPQDGFWQVECIQGRHDASLFDFVKSNLEYKGAVFLI